MNLRSCGAASKATYSSVYTRKLPIVCSDTGSAGDDSLCILLRYVVVLYAGMRVACRRALPPTTLRAAPRPPPGELRGWQRRGQSIRR